MKEITIPESVDVKSQIGEVVQYSFFELLEEHCWTDPAWRKDKDHYSSFLSLREKLGKSLDPGSKIRVSDEEYEHLRPIATLEGVKLNKDVSNITYLIGAVIMASTVTGSSKDEKKKSN